MLPAGRLVRVTRASIQTSVVQAQQHQRGELHPRRDQRAPLRADPFVGKGNRARVNPPRPPPTCSKRTLSKRAHLTNRVFGGSGVRAKKKGRAISKLNVFQEVFKF